MHLLSSLTFVPRTPTPLPLGWKEDRATGAHPAFAKHCRAESSCGRLSPRGLHEEQRRRPVCQHQEAFGESCPRSHVGRAWALTLLTGRGRSISQTGEGQLLQLPSRPAMTPPALPQHLALFYFLKVLMKVTHHLHCLFPRQLHQGRDLLSILW